MKVGWKRITEFSFMLSSQFESSIEQYNTSKRRVSAEKQYRKVGILNWKKAAWVLSTNNTNFDSSDIFLWNQHFFLGYFQHFGSCHSFNLLLMYKTRFWQLVQEKIRRRTFWRSNYFFRSCKFLRYKMFLYSPTWWV